MPYKNKKARYRLYDYAYIALWDSSHLRPTASNLESKYIKLRTQKQSPRYHLNHNLSMISSAEILSINVNPNHFFPKSFIEAPIR